MSLVAGIETTRHLAPLVREPVRFSVRYAGRRRVTARYTMRDSGIVVNLRHGTPDIATFEQVFRLEHCGLPEGALDGIDKPQVADLGANIGLFGAYVLGHYRAASIVAFEPEPSNAEVHAATIGANGLGDRWKLVRACAAVAEGETPFETGMYALSHAVRNGSGATTVRAVDVFPYLDGADLIKIDIEGAEWELLQDDRLGDLRPAAVLLEYHAQECPEPDPHAFAERLLGNAGFATADAPYSHAYPSGHGMIWAWRD